MPVGSNTYRGLAVPLNGETKIKQVKSTNDILTIEQVAANGDFLVLRRSVGTELFVVNSAGKISTLNGGIDTAGSLVLGGGIVLGATKRIRFSSAQTTKAATGVTKGELFIIWHGSIPRIAICTSTGGDTIKTRAIKSKTLGRLT